MNLYSGRSTFFRPPVQTLQETCERESWNLAAFQELRNARWILKGRSRACCFRGGHLGTQDTDASRQSSRERGRLWEVMLPGRESGNKGHGSRWRKSHLLGTTSDSADNGAPTTILYNRDRRTFALGFRESPCSVAPRNKMDSTTQTSTLLRGYYGKVITTRVIRISERGLPSRSVGTIIDTVSFPSLKAYFVWKRIFYDCVFAWGLFTLIWFFFARDFITFYELYFLTNFANSGALKIKEESEKM